MRRLGMFARGTMTSGKSPRRRFLPGVAGLEGRQLLASAVTILKATPAILTPPNERFVKVQVTGAVIETRKHVVPTVHFYVTDEYRLNQSTGPVKLTPIPGAQAWSFTFPLKLQAQRANADTSGRHYYVAVGTTDQDNSQGLTIPVLVPHDALKPGQVIKSTAEHPTKKQLKRLPDVSPPPKTSATAGLPAFGSLFGGGSNSGKNPLSALLGGATVGKKK